MEHQAIPVIDGHEDIAFNALQCTGKDFFLMNGLTESHLKTAPQLNQSDLPRLKKGRVKIVFGVVFPYRLTDDEKLESSIEFAEKETVRQIEYYLELEKNSEGSVRIVRNVEDLHYCMSHDNTLGIVLLLEDALGVRSDLSNLEELYMKGLRAIGPVWNDDNHFSGGTNSDKGLTSSGVSLLKKMSEMGFMLDTAHMNETSFFEATEAFSGNIFNSHSCAAALNPHRRNLTDAQINEIGKRGGVIGVAFVRKFLNASPSEASIEDILRHIEHMIVVSGSDSVALGSDFDGMAWPGSINGIEDVSYISNITSELVYRLGEDVANQIGWKNWYRFLEKSLPKE